jgi:hypothetical protein
MLAWIRDKVEFITDGYKWKEEEIITWAMVCFHLRLKSLTDKVAAVYHQRYIRSREYLQERERKGLWKI